MHLWHKWSTVEKRAATGTMSNLWGSREEHVIVEVQKCRCGKERGIIHFQNGRDKNIHPDFIRGVPVATKPPVKEKDDPCLVPLIPEKGQG